MAHEASNNVAHVMIDFDSLAADKIYRARLGAHDDARVDFAFAEKNRLILREIREFLRPA